MQHFILFLFSSLIYWNYSKKTWQALIQTMRWFGEAVPLDKLVRQLVDLVFDERRVAALYV
jgi:hypothetical protein